MTDQDRHGQVVIYGLQDFRKAVVALQGKKEFQTAMKQVAQIVVDDAQARMPVRTGSLQRSYRARANGPGARIIWGGTKAIYAPWMEFGGRKHGNRRGRTTGRTQPVDRRRIAKGRYLYPAIDRNRSKVEDAVIRELNDLVRKFGQEVTGDGR